MNDCLPALRERGLLTDLDGHFARFMARLATESAPRSAEEASAIKAGAFLELAAALVGALALVPGQGATGLVVSPTTDVLIARRSALLIP